MSHFELEGARFLDGLREQPGVARVVLDQQQTDRPIKHRGAPCGSLTKLSQKLSMELATRRNCSRSTGLLM